MAAGPGWYPDPNDPHTTRYWNGTEYTSVRVWNGTNWVEQPPAPPPPHDDAGRGRDRRRITHTGGAGTRWLVWIGAAVRRGDRPRDRRSRARRRHGREPATVRLGLALGPSEGSRAATPLREWTTFDVDHSPTDDDCGCVADYTESHYTLDEAKRVTRVLPAFDATAGRRERATRGYLRGVNDACF